MSILTRYLEPESIMKSRGFGGDEFPASRDVSRAFFAIGIPAIFEALMNAVISMVDSLMVSSMGKEAIAAVGLSGQARMIPISLFYAFNIGVVAVISRCKGRDDRKAANNALRQALIVTFAMLAVIVTLMVVFVKEIVVFSGAKADTLIGSEVYLRYVLYGMPFNIIMMCINASQRGIGNARMTFTSNLIANIVNVIFNWLLIGGKVGFPALGLKGAAIATSLGNLCGCLFALYSVMRPGRFLQISFRNGGLRLDMQTLRPMIKVGASAAVEQLMFRIGFFVFSRIIAELGTTSFATHQIVNNYTNLIFAFSDGAGMTASSLVGQSLGRKKPHYAELYCMYAVRILCILSVAFILICIFGGSFLVSLYSKEADVISSGAQIMVLVGLTVPMFLIQPVFTKSLRIAGDNKYAAFTAFIGIGIIRTVGAYLLCFPCGLGLFGAWVSFAIDQTFRLFSNAVRFLKGKWKTIEL